MSECRSWMSLRFARNAGFVMIWAEQRKGLQMLQYSALPVGPFSVPPLPAFAVVVPGNIISAELWPDIVLLARWYREIVGSALKSYLAGTKIAWVIVVNQVIRVRLAIG